MSVVTSTFDLPLASPLPTPPAPAPDIRPAVRPWAFWGTLGWSLFAVAAGLLAAVAYAVVWMLTHGIRMPDPEDAIYGTVAGMVGSLAPMVVLVVAIKIRKWQLREYFALEAVSRRDLVLGTASLAALIVVFEVLAVLLGVDNGSQYTDATYRAAKLASALPLLWLAVVAVAPVTEELLFRGFLHRGWAASRLGVVGTIVLTSALWAALHQQYNLLGIAFIFSMGLIFGWMRQRSGSTTLTIALHGLNNLFTTILVTAKLEWLS